MKRLFFVFLFALAASGASARQQLRQTDSITLCGRKFEIPPDARLTDKQQLSADTYTITWQYPSERKLEKLMANTISDLSKQPGFSQVPLDCYFLGSAGKAFGLTFNGTAGTILIAATVNRQPVFVQLSLAKAVFTNEQLPSFISTLITLSR